MSVLSDKTPIRLGLVVVLAGALLAVGSKATAASKDLEQLQARVAAGELEQRRQGDAIAADALERQKLIDKVDHISERTDQIWRELEKRHGP